MGEAQPVVTLTPDILSEFPVQLARRGFRFFLSRSCPAPEALVDAVAENAAPEQVIKSSRRRNVLLTQGMVIKKYAFHHLSDVLHSRRYGPREFECYRRYQAAFGAIPEARVPQLYAYFERPFCRWLYLSNGIASEYIPHTRFLTPAEMPKAAPLFANLYRKGIYHSDMQVMNVLYSDETGLLYPIDHIGCNFLDAPNAESLLIQVARFAQTCQGTDRQQRAFLDAVLDKIPALPWTRDSIWECVCKLIAQPLHTHQYHHVELLSPPLRQLLRLQDSCKPAKTPYI